MEIIRILIADAEELLILRRLDQIDRVIEPQDIELAVVANPPPHHFRRLPCRSYQPKTSGKHADKLFRDSALLCFANDFVRRRVANSLRGVSVYKGMGYMSQSFDIIPAQHVPDGMESIVFE